MSAPTDTALQAPIEVTGESGKGTHRLHTAILVYALTAGVGWWSLHLTALATFAPAVCEGSPAWILTLINVVCFLGVASSIAAAAYSRRARSDLDNSVGRSRFVGYVAIAFNAAALVAVTLESLPVYVLGACQ